MQRACQYSNDLHVVGPSAAVACTVSSSSSSRQPKANRRAQWRSTAAVRARGGARRRGAAGHGGGALHSTPGRGACQPALHRTRQPSHVYYNFTTTCLLQEVLFTRDEGAPTALTTRTQLALARTLGPKIKKSAKNKIAKLVKVWAHTSPSIILTNYRSKGACSRRKRKYNVWSVNDELSGNLRKSAGNLHGRFILLKKPTGNLPEAY